MSKSEMECERAIDRGSYLSATVSESCLTLVLRGSEPNVHIVNGRRTEQ